MLERMDMTQFSLDAKPKLPPPPKPIKQPPLPVIRIPDVMKKHIKRNGKK